MLENVNYHVSQIRNADGGYMMRISKCVNYIRQDIEIAIWLGELLNQITRNVKLMDIFIGLHNRKHYEVNYIHLV